MDEDPLCAASFLLYRFLQYMCWERGYDKDKLRKVIGSWKKHNGGRYIGDVPQAIPHTGDGSPLYQKGTQTERNLLCDRKMHRLRDGRGWKTKCPHLHDTACRGHESPDTVRRIG